MRLVVMVLFGLSAAAIAGVWYWLGQPIEMPHAAAASGDKLHCVSYAPFRENQSPFNRTTKISAQDLDADLAKLARLTDCVRTYATDLGNEQVPALAARHGLKVMQGIWLGRTAEDNRVQVEAGIRLANQFPDVIRSLVVGNEVLLRGEMTAAALAETIRTVKERVQVPVTYADVWEFWLRYREVAAAVDFITIHILPYWEDFPIPADDAAAHVGAIRQRVAQAFDGREVLIGEVGWPSQGRMREGALPSPANQARVIQDVLATAKREKFLVNVIEAFDQPWKRALEGTVGGYWGLLDARARESKFGWGEAVSNHPRWRWQAGGGIAFAALVFGAAFTAARRGAADIRAWVTVAAIASIGGILVGWTAAQVPIESWAPGRWLRSLSLAAIAFSAPVAAAAAVTAGIAIPRFSRIIGPAAQRTGDRLAVTFGIVAIAATLLAVMTALGLVFDPRYRDFPFAAFTCAAVPLLLNSVAVAQPAGRRGASEIAGASVLALSVLYVAFNESFANWQSLWLCGALIVLAVILVRVRDAPG